MDVIDVRNHPRINRHCASISFLNKLMVIRQTTPSDLIAVQTGVEISTITYDAFVVRIAFFNTQSTNAAPSRRVAAGRTRRYWCDIVNHWVVTRLGMLE